jgi:hypothetical protein
MSNMKEEEEYVEVNTSGSFISISLRQESVQRLNKPRDNNGGQPLLVRRRG